MGGPLLRYFPQTKLSEGMGELRQAYPPVGHESTNHALEGPTIPGSLLMAQGTTQMGRGRTLCTALEGSLSYTPAPYSRCLGYYAHAVKEIS